jgi:hypothetical protein
MRDARAARRAASKASVSGSGSRFAAPRCFVSLRSSLLSLRKSATVWHSLRQMQSKNLSRLCTIYQRVMQASLHCPDGQQAGCSQPVHTLKPMLTVPSKAQQPEALSTEDAQQTVLNACMLAATSVMPVQRSSTGLLPHKTS